jgi:hypothetical protein
LDRKLQNQSSDPKFPEKKRRIKEKWSKQAEINREKMILIGAFSSLLFKFLNKVQRLF